MYLDENLAFFHENFDNQDELLEFLGQKLINSGVAKKNYIRELKVREKEYPTGIKTETYGVAIPHTDNEYVNTSQIAYLSLKEPVEFENMDGSGKVQVSLVIMLALDGQEEQLNMLQKLMLLFADAENLEKIYACDNQKDLIYLFNKIGIE